METQQNIFSIMIQLFFFFSTHDQFAYPGTGSPKRKGNGKGLGFNINVHLPCKTKDEQIIKVFDQILVPKAHKFKPDFITGETVRVTNGPFADFNGIIEEINLDQSKVTVLVNIFGRETPVELGFTDIVKN